jgi:hypothetical protein
MHTRDEVRTALDRNFKSLMDCLGQLTEEELTERPVAGDWTVKDIIAHVWDRGDEVLHMTKVWRGPRPWQAGVSYDDAWNEAHVNARRVLPLISVVDGVTGVHRRLVHFLDVADDDILAQVGKAPWDEVEMALIEMLYETAEHYARHAQSLTVFQLNCLGGDNDQPRDSIC